MFEKFFQKFEKKAVRAISGQRFLSIQLDITNNCNLNCTHCYHANHSNEGSLVLNDWIEILNEYQNLLNLLSLKPSVIISGGEPLTCNFLFDLIFEIRNRWPLVTIIVLTNGTLLDEKIVEFFKNNEVSIQVSIEASSAISHDRIRGNGSFYKTVNGVNLAVKEGLIVYILTILSTRTSKEIKPLFDLAKNLKVTALNFTRLIPQEKTNILAQSSEDRVLSGIQLRDAYKQILSSSNETGVMTNTDKPLYVLIDKSLGKNSLFGFQGLVVNYQGNLKVSSRSDFILGNVKKKGLKNLFLKNSIMKKLRRGKIEICGQCEYYKRCGGDRNMSYFHHGDFFKVDPGCWLVK